MTGEKADDAQGAYRRAGPRARPASPRQPESSGQYGGVMARGRGMTVIFCLALAGLAVSVVGVSIQLLPRQFSSAQQQKIMTWEAGNRWHGFSAGQIFPGTIGYGPPAALDDVGSSLTLTAKRLGIARQAPCRAATDPAAARILARNGCEAVLRSTYADDTETYVATVGVVPFPSPAQAEEAQLELGARQLRMRDGRTPGVSAVPFAGTPAAGFTSSRRQLSANVVSGPYLVMYAVGYTDSRPLVPVSADSYADAEMTSFGKGVAQNTADTLGNPPPLPHCPGAPGC